MESRNVVWVGAALVGCVLACGCNSISSSKQSLQLKPSDIVATVFEPEYKVRNMPVTATAEQKHFLGFSWGDADLYSDQIDEFDQDDTPEVRRLKKAASSMACNAANCDLLVATVYQFEQSGFLFSTIRCTVKGYPTDVVAVRPMSSPRSVQREIPRVQELSADGVPAAPATGTRVIRTRPAAPAGEVRRVRELPPADAPAAPAGESRATQKSPAAPRPEPEDPDDSRIVF